MEGPDHGEAAGHGSPSHLLPQALKVFILNDHRREPYTKRSSQGRGRSPARIALSWRRMRPVEVTFYTRERCSLCEKAKAAIRASGVPVRLTEVDVDADDLLRDLYGHHVPVIHIEGKEAFRHFVHPEEFAEYVLRLRAG